MATRSLDVCRLWDGAVFHTYGMILTFQAFDGKDLRFFASAVDDMNDIDEGIPFLAGTIPDVEDGTSPLPVSDIIRRRPLPFLRLFAWQRAPVTSGRGGVWTFAASVIKWSGVFDPAEQASWSHLVDGIQDFIVHPEGAVGFRIASEGPMYDPVVVFSGEDGILFLRGMTDGAYARGRRAVAPVAEFPEHPDVRVSLTMHAAAYQILDIVDVLTQLEKLVTPGDDDAAGDGAGPDLGDITMDQIQPVLNLLMESHNEGKNYSDTEIATQIGVTAEQVRMLRHQVEGVLHRVDSAHPVPDRFGLAPKPFHALFTRRTPQAEGVFALKDFRKEELTEADNALLAATPIVQFARWVIQQRGLPATAAGYVSPETVRRALDEGIVTRYFSADEDVSEFDDSSQPRKELDAAVFHYYRKILETAKILRLKQNTFEVDPAAADIFGHDAMVAPLYRHLAEALFEHVPWDEPLYGSPYPYLRDSVGFLLYALNKLSLGNTADEGGWVNVNHLVDVFLGAHPDLAKGSKHDIRQATFWINVHVDAQFGHHLCIPLGLAELRRTVATVMIRPTRTFRTVFDTE